MKSIPDFTDSNNNNNNDDDRGIPQHIEGKSTDSPEDADERDNDDDDDDDSCGMAEVFHLEDNKPVRLVTQSWIATVITAKGDYRYG
ncbi:hypothetical protein RP20_CCG001458 [Aedes albopictus]|nr:hypothetical protein RP20_CCG001458 [Aedes albopictus]